eukprot:275525_1
MVRSLQISTEIVQIIAEFTCGGYKCQYFEYCQSYVDVSSNDVSKYVTDMFLVIQESVNSKYMNDRPYQIICNQCKAKSVQCGSLLTYVGETVSCHYLSVYRKCKSCNRETIKECPTCCGTECKYCDLFMGG